MFYNECTVCNDVGVVVTVENSDTRGCLCMISKSMGCSFLCLISQV